MRLYTIFFLSFTKNTNQTTLFISLPRFSLKIKKNPRNNYRVNIGIPKLNRKNKIIKTIFNFLRLLVSIDACEIEG